MPDSYKPDTLLGQLRGREVPTGTQDLADIKPCSCKGPTALLCSGWPCPEEVSNGVLLTGFKPHYNWIIGAILLSFCPDDSGLEAALQVLASQDMPE